jgi:hypothetical protein
MAKGRKRAVSVSELLNTSFKVMDFSPEWEEYFGRPERSGCWLVWGPPHNGKTGFLLKLAKFLTNFGVVAYNSLEEGVSESLKRACVRENMLVCGNRFRILDKEPIEDLEIRLMKRRSPDIVMIDSVQYTELNKRTAKTFIDKFPNKLFIFISHASGKVPDGRTAHALRFHADVKIWVEGYKANIESRFGGDKSKQFTIWKEGAELYHGKN